MTTASLVLPVRGKAAKLVDERGLPGHLKCSSCQQAVFNSFQSPHGCRLCQTCVDALPVHDKVPCPGKTEACRDKEEDTDISQSLCFPDMASRREIGKLSVFCPNKVDGCGAKFQWREIEAHLSNCDFEKIQCDMCGEGKLKRELAEHQRRDCRQRRVSCGDCHVQVVAQAMESEHRNLQSSSCCSAFTAPCPHCGEGQMKRPEYLIHLSSCRQRPTPCKFAHVGCAVVDAAEKLGAHYQDAADRHLEMIDNKLKLAAMGAAASAPPVAAAAASVTSPERASQEVAQLDRMLMNVFTVFKRLQPNVATWAQRTIDLEDLMKAFGGPNGFKTLLKAMDDKLRQLEATDRGSRLSGSAATSATPSETARLMEIMKAIEQRFDTLEMTSFDGCLTWKVTGVAARRREAKSGSPASLFSAPFFSRRYGYMFRVRLFLNGYDGAEGTWVSIQLVLMQSEYDDVLDWPLVADVTFRLVNPRSRTEDVISKSTMEAQRPATAEDFSMNVSVTKFAKITIVEEKFVRNDSIYLETEVEPRRNRRR